MIYIIRNPILWLGISAYGGGVLLYLATQTSKMPTKS
jgi:hypothetical protein